MKLFEEIACQRLTFKNRFDFISANNYFSKNDIEVIDAFSSEEISLNEIPRKVETSKSGLMGFLSGIFGFILVLGFYFLIKNSFPIHFGRINETSWIFVLIAAFIISLLFGAFSIFGYFLKNAILFPGQQNQQILKNDHFVILINPEDEKRISEEIEISDSERIIYRKQKTWLPIPVKVEK